MASRAAAARSPSAAIAGSSGMPGRNSRFSCRSLMSATTSASRAQSDDVAAGAPRDHGERRAPGAPADDEDRAHAAAPAAGVSEASGQRGRGAKSSGSVAPSASRSAPAQAIIAALSVQ